MANYTKFQFDGENFETRPGFWRGMFIDRQPLESRMLKVFIAAGDKAVDDVKDMSRDEIEDLEKDVENTVDDAQIMFSGMPPRVAKLAAQTRAMAINGGEDEVPSLDDLISESSRLIAHEEIHGLRPPGAWSHKPEVEGLVAPVLEHLCNSIENKRKTGPQAVILARRDMEKAKKEYDKLLKRDEVSARVHARFMAMFQLACDWHEYMGSLRKARADAAGAAAVMAEIVDHDNAIARLERQAAGKGVGFFEAIREAKAVPGDIREAVRGTNGVIETILATKNSEMRNELLKDYFRAAGEVEDERAAQKKAAGEPSTAGESGAALAKATREEMS